MPQDADRSPAGDATGAAPLPVFDGHNDLLLHLWRAGDRDGRGFFEGRSGHIDLAKCRKGGVRGGFFACWVPGGGDDEPDPEDPAPTYPPVGPERARRVTLSKPARATSVPIAA